MVTQEDVLLQQRNQASAQKHQARLITALQCVLLLLLLLLLWVLWRLITALQCMLLLLLLLLLPLLLWVLWWLRARQLLCRGSGSFKHCLCEFVCKGPWVSERVGGIFQKQPAAVVCVCVCVCVYMHTTHCEECFCLLSRTSVVLTLM